MYKNKPLNLLIDRLREKAKESCKDKWKPDFPEFWIEEFDYALNLLQEIRLEDLKTKHNQFAIEAESQKKMKEALALKELMMKSRLIKLGHSEESSPERVQVLKHFGSDSTLKWLEKNITRELDITSTSKSALYEAIKLNRSKRNELRTAIGNLYGCTSS